MSSTTHPASPYQLKEDIEHHDPQQQQQQQQLEELDSWKCHSNLTALLEEGPSIKDKYGTLSELQQIEFQRREILQCVELPFWRILTFWNGTCLKALALDWLIWVPIIIYLTLRVQAHLGVAMPELIALMGKTDTNILGSFLSFLLVLFVNQTNARFFDMYKLSKACGGQIQDAAGLASTWLQRKQPDRTSRLIRYLNAAQIAGYVGLGGSPYSLTNFFEALNQKYGLLTGDDLSRLTSLRQMNHGPATFKELIRWAHAEIGHAQEEGALTDYQAAQLQQCVLGLRTNMDGIYNFCDQPTHFFYIHFLCLLSALYLPIFAIDNAFQAGWGDDGSWAVELLTGTIVVLQAIFVVGLRLLGQKLSDPFGDDLEDLSILTYVEGTIKNTQILLNQASLKTEAGQFA